VILNLENHDPFISYNKTKPTTVILMKKHASEMSTGKMLQKTERKENSWFGLGIKRALNCNWNRSRQALAAAATMLHA
jgi:hypothetical protein